MLHETLEAHAAAGTAMNFTVTHRDALCWLEDRSGAEVNVSLEVAMPHCTESHMTELVRFRGELGRDVAHSPAIAGVFTVGGPEGACIDVSGIGAPAGYSFDPSGGDLLIILPGFGILRVADADAPAAAAAA
jgi:hypothetical protein